MKFLPYLLVLATFMVYASSAKGEVSLPKVFGSNMVLQQQVPIVAWGWDTPGTTITVTLGDKSAQATANQKGEWKAVLPAREADGKAYTLTVQGTSVLTFDNVLIGEVWLASGQSNMEREVDGATIATADCPNLRLLHVTNKLDAKPQRDIAGAWVVCSSSTLHGFSAVAYFFGREIQTNLKVPVGVIESALPGSPIEAWMPPEGFAMLSPTLKKPDKMWPPPLFLYNGMIHPLVPFPVRGVIWYQGEANRADGPDYTEKMKALIASWRKIWSTDFPFYFVQIGPLQYPDEAPGVGPEFWEAQAAVVKEVPKTGMVVINDIASLHGDVASLQLHPPNKLDVGKRLARLALARTYGQKDLVDSGPTFQTMAVEGDKIRVTFDHIGGGLMARDGQPLDSFEIIDADQGDFMRATAVIDGASVVLSAPEVKKPVAMRFAWSNTAMPNLMNKEGLPTGAFRAGNMPTRSIPPATPVPPTPAP